nr:hypothetical protein Itr_chr03CG16820 [Ipomoea trifida]
MEVSTSFKGSQHALTIRKGASLLATDSPSELEADTSSTLSSASLMISKSAEIFPARAFKASPLTDGQPLAVYKSVSMWSPIL